MKRPGGEVDIILGKAPPPGKMRPASDPDADGDTEGCGDDYDAALDSMSAFIDAVKGGDPKAALDAWEDVKSNC